MGLKKVQLVELNVHGHFTHQTSGCTVTITGYVSFTQVQNPSAQGGAEHTTGPV